MKSKFSPSCIAVLLVSSSILLGGCGQSDVAKPEPPVAATSTQPASPAPEAATPAQDKAPAQASFSDTKGMFGEKEVGDLVRIGVLDASGGKFRPTEPLTRAEFVEWLVKSNNALRPDEIVRTAEPGAKSSFPDVSDTHPQFKYIQGMADSGWSIGYEDKTFKPDKNLTREEMIGIKALFDKEPASSNGPEWMLGNTWTDWKKIGKAFIDPMGREAGNQTNWKHIYGTTKNCDPQKTVSRAEGAVCVWQVGRFPVNAGDKK